MGKDSAVPVGTSNIAVSATLQTSPEHDKFLFDCDHLVTFCTQFEQCEIQDQTDSVLEVKLEDLENRWVKLQATYECLMLSPKSTNTKDFKENAKINFNASSEAYYTARSQILDILRISGGNARQSGSTRYTLTPSQLTHLSTQNPSLDNICIKVPPCDTEIFKGGYEEWPSFRDMFTAVYVNHPRLTQAQKLYHLRNKTRGGAGAIVKRYSLCDENFELAWNALKARYENKRVLVDNQLKILFNISVATVENSESIQKIQSTVNDCLCTLKTLDVNIASWDPILIYLISTKLPDETLALWEQSLRSHRDLPNWSQLDEFLINRYEVVERISSIRSTKECLPAPNPSKVQTYLSQEKLNLSCPLCESKHSIRVCPEFRKLTSQQRIDFVFKNKICNNCLSPSHLKNKCKSTNTCISCHKPHHSLLHVKYKATENVDGRHIPNQSYIPQRQDFPTNVNSPKFEAPSTSLQDRSSQVQANFSSNNDTILLRTALVQIEHRGELFTIRALIDPGSQRTFLSEKVRNRLQIPSTKSHFEIIGIGGQRQTSERECELVIVSEKHDTRFNISAIVLPKVTKRLPTVSFEISNPSDLQELELADPHFNKSSQIDLILGNDSERFINIEGIKKNICGDTSAYNTIFGWVLSGPIRTETVHSFSTNVVQHDDHSLSDLLRKFWEQEEVPTSPHISAADKFCEEHYKRTTTREPDGRYVVRLPFKSNFPESIFLGSSRFIALAQNSRMEKNLSKDPDLESQYTAVLKEYISLDHVEETSPREISSDGKFKSYYLPHHAVVRPEHKTTKVRIVFNASRKTKSGHALNDVLHTGPTLQSDLISTILNWRKYQFVFSGDIQKMYRQILVHPLDRPYQRILFRKNHESPVKDYQLKTVTFGINCAPFLAIRTILQLASDSEFQFPNVAKILRKETYVDDILSGGFSIKDTIQAQDELIATLKSAGFPLKKITANDPNLLAHLPPEDLYDSEFLRLHESSSTKTLGINWNALTDTFSYSLGSKQQGQSMTKRQVLSAVAQLFDPAGWITPVVIRSKVLMQQLWLEGLGWDDNLSPDSQIKWNNLVSDLSHIETISIPRWIQYLPTDHVDIHGFSDASQAAYCACVYVRCQTSKPIVFSNLLLAKSRVAPLQPVCLPRLELNGAFLLAKLINYVISTFDFKFDSITLWTDSSIVLGWLSKPPWTWETYVANRTAQIHDLVPNGVWRHVPTHDNPADLGTRGCKPQDLAHNPLWFNGPNWLTNPSSTWPKKNPLAPPETGKRANVQVLHETIEEPDILLRFSSYPRALRVISYVFRFFNKSIRKIRNTPRITSISVTHSEVKFTKHRLISLAQRKHYESEYEMLSDSKVISDKSPLNNVNPFLDSNQMLRVNGRHYGNTHGKSNILTSGDLTSFMYQVAKGMDYLTSRGIIHRDLAARNILITDDHTCKVADFGFARDVVTSKIYERKSEGKLPIRWMSIESLYDNLFSVKSDIWSFGILMWEIVTLGSTPYPGISASDVMRKVRDGYRLEKPEHCRRELYNIMYYCWSQDQNDRPSFGEIIQMLDRLLHTEMDYIELERFPDHNYYNILSLSGEKV